MSDIKVKEVVDLISDAGGRIVGRTRLQKIAYLLTATGLDDSFKFIYKHYGPFSDSLASSAEFGALFGDLSEVKTQTQWGATYSTYSVSGDASSEGNESRKAVASIAVASDSIELELAATAVFLSYEGYPDPWKETVERKPEKATFVRIQNAKKLLIKLSNVPVPQPIPAALYS
ncbi:hypothetical protein [Paracoccus pacificus]|uniref:Antitoxin SocA-like Panacea domain-containing protein n=1 Tax=Paracoccus pacificus TaxID=1463598 RepID=A0ABW4R8A0_9RHOB